MEFNEHILITLVEQNELLYNKRSGDFKNVNKKQQAWEKIGQEIGASGASCKKRFANLREKFTREVRQQTGASGSGAVCQSNWPFFDSMQFLRGHLVQRQQRYNFNPVVASTSSAQESSMCEMSFSVDDCIVEEPEIMRNTDDAVTSPPSQRTPKPNRKRTTELDEFCEEFRASSKAFTKTIEALETQDAHIAGCTQMATASLMKMGYRKKMQTIRKIMNVIWDAELEEDSEKEN